MIERLPKFAKKALVALGFRLRLCRDDRRILEEQILPFFAARAEVKRVLFVGCDWYTAWYQHLFSNAEYWTLEIDPDHRVYGAPRHIVDGAQNVTVHFAAASLDLIVCNGVFGWGLDGSEQVVQAFSGFARCLKPGGVLVLGWNDVPQRKPFPPEECADRFFDQFVFPPIGQSRLRTANVNGHTFDFYVVKPTAT